MNTDRPDNADVFELIARMSPETWELGKAAAYAWYARELARPLRADRRRMQRRTAIKRFGRAIIAHETERELLDALLAIGRFYSVKKIRYHRLMHRGGDDELVSVDCAGHGEEQAIQMRLGNILKRRSMCPLETSDSFLCLERKTPIVFRIDSDASMPLREVNSIGGIALIVLARSQCECVLDDSPYRMRIDFPLIRAGRAIGKLSCDLGIDRLSATVARRLIRFWQYVLMTADSFAALFTGRMARLIPSTNAVRDQIVQIPSIRALFGFCVEELPKRFNILHASVLTLTKDATDSVRLILRRTSYTSSRVLEDGATDESGRQGYYQVSPDPDNAITCWVARAGRSVRLQDLGNKGLLSRQLRVLDPGLQWMNKVQDSRSHTSFLAVPIKAGNEILGVLRFTEKACGRENAHFTEIDEHCLAAIAADYIGPRLAELQRSESKDIFCNNDWRQTVVKALTETFRPNNSAMRDRRHASFRLAMKQVFRETGESRHLCLVNYLPAQSSHFTALSASGSLALPIRDYMGKHYDVEHTITGRVIQDQRPIYLHDWNRARRMGFVVPRFPGAASVIACPVSLGERGTGAIVLLSDRHDILPEIHGPLLEYVSNETTQILTCRYRPTREE